MPLGLLVHWIIDTTWAKTCEVDAVMKVTCGWYPIEYHDLELVWIEMMIESMSTTGGFVCSRSSWELQDQCVWDLCNADCMSTLCLVIFFWYHWVYSKSDLTRYHRNFRLIANVPRWLRHHTSYSIRSMYPMIVITKFSCFLHTTSPCYIFALSTAC